MTKTLVRGGDILTLDPAGTVLRGADVSIADGAVVAVGDSPLHFEPDEIVDAHQHIVMPGIYDANAHSGTVYSRGASGVERPDPWFDLRITQDAQINGPRKASVSAEDAYWAALLAAAEMIRGGVVGFRDQYFYMDRVAQAVYDCGMRGNLAWCTFGDEDGEIGGDVADVAAFVETWQGAGEGRIKTSFGPHSAYLCSPQFLARTAAVAARMGVGIHIRVSESQEQVDLSLMAHDLTPVQLLDQNGVLDLPVVAVNAAYLTEFDLEILAARGVTVVACPRAQAASGLATVPFKELSEAGVATALGSDGAVLAGTLDMFEVMRCAQWGPPRTAVLPVSALGLATWGGAQAAGFPSSGRLIPGQAADLILINCRQPHLWPFEDPMSAVTLGVRAGDVTDVMVAGRWLMRKKELVTIDEERVLHEASQRTGGRSAH